MTSATRDRNADVTIELDRQVDFFYDPVFRSAYADNPPFTRYRIDCGKVRRMDGAFAAMLLCLLDHNGGSSRYIKLVNCGDQVRQKLEQVGFHRLFRTH